MAIKSCCFDIETTNLQADYGVVLCACVKPDGKPPITFRGDKMVPGWKQKRSNDAPLVQALAEELSKYEIWVAYNGARFDIPFLNTRLMKNGMMPLPVPKSLIDPVLLARNKLKLSYNSLEKLAQHLGCSSKTDVDSQMWIEAALDGSVKAMNYIVKHCVTPNHLTLTKDLRWVEVGSLSVGDEIVAFEEEPSSLYGRKYRSAIIEAVSFREEPVFDVELSNGHIITTTAEHRWLAKRNLEGRGWVWKMTSKLVPASRKGGIGMASCVAQVLPVFQEDVSRDSGYLAGIFDGEGCLTNNHSVTFSQRPGAVLDRSLSILNEMGKKYGLSVINNESHSGIGRKDCRRVNIRGFLPDRLAMLGSVRPSRLLQKVDPDGFGRMEIRNQGGDCVYKIKDVRPAGVQEIVSVQTSSGTLFIDGYPMHNCQEDVITLEKVVDKMKHTCSGFNTWGSAR